ncbi:helix-turn-helix domain-containing protein [Enterococcus sp. N249-2]
MEIKVVNRLKMLRKNKNLTITQLSELTGFPQSTLTNYENGKRQPRRTETWRKLANFFDVSTAYLMGVSDDPSLDVQSFDYDNFINDLQNTVTERLEIEKQRYIDAFDRLNEKGKTELFNYSNYLYSQDEYKQDKEIITKTLTLEIPKELAEKYAFPREANDDDLTKK